EPRFIPANPVESRFIPATPAAQLPAIQPPQTVTIGEQYARMLPATDAPSQASAAPAQRQANYMARALEILWVADDAEARVRTSAVIANILGPALPAESSTEAPGSRQVASRRLIQRGLARLHPVDDITRAFWDAVDQDGVLTPPFVAI